MSAKISLQEFKANNMQFTMNMHNLLQLAEDSYDEGPERQAAYAKIAVGLGMSPNVFDDLI